jgi:hypothetical protein
MRSTEAAMRSEMTKEEAEFIVLQYLDAGMLDKAEELAEKIGMKGSEWSDLRETQYIDWNNEYDE